MSQKRSAAISNDTIKLNDALKNLEIIEQIEPEIIEEYKNLNEKFDQVILKIKNRKKSRKEESNT